MDLAPFLTVGVILLPLAGGLIVLILPEMPKFRIREVTGVAVAALTAWFGARLVGAVGSGSHALGVSEVLRSLRIGRGLESALQLELPGIAGPKSIPLGFFLDPLAVLTVFAAAAVAVLVIVYACTGIRQGLRRGEFFAFALWALGCVNLAVLSDNTFMVFCGWTLSSFILFYLVTLGGDRARHGAGRTMVLLGAGDCLLLLGCVLLAAQGVSMGRGRLGVMISEWATSPDRIPLSGSRAGLNPVAYLLILGGILARIGALPLHGWVPRAAGGAPAPVMALMPAGLDKLLGSYMLLRISFHVFDLSNAGGLRLLLMVLGGAGVLFGSLAALVQHDLRRALAYHGVCQSGYLVLGVACAAAAGVAGVCLHVIATVLFMVALFMAVGTVERCTGTTEIARLGGLGRRMPLTFAFSMVAGLSAAGVPLLAGFNSKWMIFNGLLGAAGQVGSAHLGPVFSLVAVMALVVALLGAALTLAGMLRTARAAFTGPVSSHCEGARAAGALAFVPMGLLAAGTLLLGLLPNLLLTRTVLGPVIEGCGFDGGFLGASHLSFAPEGAGFWSPMLAGALVLAALASGDLLFGLLGVRRMRVVPPFVDVDSGAMAEEDLAYPAPEFSDIAGELGGLATLQSDAGEGVYDPYELLGSGGQRLVDAAGGLHRNSLRRYLVLCLLGLLAVVAALLLPLVVV